jgi:hypothetical protein
MGEVPLYDRLHAKERCLERTLEVLRLKRAVAT